MPPADAQDPPFAAHRALPHATSLAFGPPELGVELAEAFDGYALEYAAIRQRVGLFHAAQKAVVTLTGNDAADYLHRLTTNDINGAAVGHSVRAFQLNEKGRITADLLLHRGEGVVHAELDAFDADAWAGLLDARLFSEDVTIARDPHAVLLLMGPAAVQALTTAGATLAAPLPNHAHTTIELAGVACTAARVDEGGALCVRLLVPDAGAPVVYAALLQAIGYDPSTPLDTDAVRRRETLRGLPVGWAAVNTVRVEEARPWFHIDFGPDSIPNETALLDEAVSFTAGCYLGQEVVVRIRDLGRPKRLAVRLAFDTSDHPDALPVAGAQLFDGDAAIGAVTSSTPSPLRSQAAVGLGVVKHGKHRPGTPLRTTADGAWIDATVQPW